MFVKAGAIIPKMPVMDYIGQMKNTPMILEVFPSKKASEFTIYEDEGTTNDYKKDEFAKTKVETAMSTSELTIEINEPEVSGGFDNSTQRNYWLEVHLSEKPSAIMLNAKELKVAKKEKLQEKWDSEFDKTGYHFDQDKKVLSVLVPDTKEKLEITIEN